MEDKDDIIKVINVTVDGINHYAIFFDIKSTFKELKKYIASKCHLIKGTFNIFQDDIDLTNEDDNITLENLFPNFNEINLKIERNKRDNEKEKIISIKINKNNNCKIHFGKTNDYFCLICKKSICLDCILNYHIKHDVQEKYNYIIPSEFIMNNIFLDDFEYKIGYRDIINIERISFQNNLKNYFIDMHKLLYKLENKLFDIIKSYIKELNDSEDNNNENIKLLRKFCVEYFTKLDNYINCNKILIDDEIYLNILNKLKDID